MPSAILIACSCILTFVTSAVQSGQVCAVISGKLLNMHGECKLASLPIGIVATLATLTLTPLVTRPFINLFCTTGLAICSARAACWLASWSRTASQSISDDPKHAAMACLQSQPKRACRRLSYLTITSGKESGMLGPTFWRVVTSVIVFLCGTKRTRTSTAQRDDAMSQSC